MTWTRTPRALDSERYKKPFRVRRSMRIGVTLFAYFSHLEDATTHARELDHAPRDLIRVERWHTAHSIYRGVR